jgi:hypothetical protein
MMTHNCPFTNQYDSVSVVITRTRESVPKNRQSKMPTGDTDTRSFMVAMYLVK